MKAKKRYTQAFVDGQNQEIGRLNAHITRLVEESTTAQRARRDAERAADSRVLEIDQLRAHVLLQGDRDALTRTIEVLARRLASPAADKDPSRGGWRSLSIIEKDRG